MTCRTKLLSRKFEISVCSGAPFLPLRPREARGLLSILTIIFFSFVKKYRKGKKWKRKSNKYLSSEEHHPKNAKDV